MRIPKYRLSTLVAGAMIGGLLLAGEAPAFAGAAAAPSVTVMTAASSVKTNTLIASAEQPEEYSYDFGTGTTVSLHRSGSALVTRPSGTPNIELIIAIIAAPRATDAAGNAVETSYLASGSVLTQVVRHRGEDVTYPIVASPSLP
ncbi:hypothetical protein [Microbacterium aurugineum]|uniref:hypothetical protein n=1 Tax=Microbacterium aurugineum TaxID=2851642 RepID=UPI0020BEA29B|nr:hypothetical protein [Microbacterium aurugineum]MCK8476680.1 hypothetical protein [Microbacterium aurugineum]